MEKSLAADSTTLVVPGHGTVFHAPVGTAMPTNPLDAFSLTGTIPAGWFTFGHTSKQNIVNFTREGGETTTLDTYLTDSVRTVVSTAARTTVNINALQVDVDTLDLAYNGEWDETGNRYIIPSNTAPLERALVALLADDTGSLLFEIPKSSVSASGTFVLDPANFLEIPIAATLLTETGATALPTVNGQPGLFAIHKATLDPTPPPAWTASTVYTVGDRVTLSGGEVLEATVGGTSGTTEPVAPAVGGTVTDGTVTWKRLS